MRGALVGLVLVACGGAKPAPTGAPSNAAPSAAVFHCDGRSARMQFSMTAGTWSHHAVRLSCNGDRPQIEVSGLRKDDDAERRVSAPLDGPAFEKAWSRLDAAGWTTLKGDAECASAKESASTETSFEITHAATHVTLVCQSFPGSLAGAYDQISSALIDTAEGAGLDETSAAKK
jgi:hypothetical protein